MYRFRIGIFLVALLVAVGCGDDDSEPPPGPSVPAPLVEGPVTGGAPIVQGTTFNLAAVGYMQEEYFVSGTSRAYTNAGELGSDGNWDVTEASTADYKTRIIVYRPIDDADFSGTVFVEWLNVSAGFDSAPDWIYSHVELIRRGHVWVGVSAQIVGIEGGGLLPIPGLDLSLKKANPARYGSLSHPGDSYSYDMYSQVGRAMREHQGVDPLGGLVAQQVIAIGESQSAFRMTTYVNAFARLAKVYDGYLIHSRGGNAAPLSEEPLPGIPVPEVVKIRTDLKVPVMTVQSETDLIELTSAPARQTDSAYFRWWEIAGTAHADVYTLLVGPGDTGNDPRAAEIIITASPIPGIIQCDNPINSGPHHFVLKAAIRALENWIRDGVEPPTSPRIELAGDPPELVLDDVGNVVGGIRTPYVDVPIAQLSGGASGGASFCFLFGKTIPFDEATLDRLYVDHETYVGAVTASTQAAVDAGFVLPPDADLIIAAAENSDVGR